MALVTGAQSLDLPGSVHAAWSDASRGDLRPRPGDPAGGAALGAFAVAAAGSTGATLSTVCWLDQVHGATVLDAPGPATGPPVLWRGAQAADALVAVDPGVALCVLTADCGSIALASPEGVFAAVHAGWRGLVGGVIERTVERMRERGATHVVGALGPCIRSGCYEFSGPDLDAAAAACGDVVRATTTDGRPALDLAAGITAALDRAGASQVPGVDVCTACGVGYFSHRARRDVGRQALVVWSTAAPMP